MIQKEIKSQQVVAVITVAEFALLELLVFVLLVVAFFNLDNDCISRFA
jgi:hypothetical protein